MPPSRRDALRAAAVSPLLAGRASARPPEPPEPPEPPAQGLFVRVREPRNLETPADGLVPWQTPTGSHYVRNHFPAPQIDPAAYRLAVTGLVERPLSLSLADLAGMPAVSRPLTMECAGNGRVFLIPPVAGAQWGIGAVGTATWAGVHLGAVLDRAGVKAGAVEVILVGADSGAVAGPPATPGPIHFDRGIPLAKARRDEVVLATRMNGEPLTADHGFPVRAVVGGWYGMAAVKWLTKVIVTDRPYQGYWQTLDYSYFERVDGLPTLRPITDILPKAVVVAAGRGPSGGRSFRASGKAWAGEADVAKVEVSTDGGKAWGVARLDDKVEPYCWRDWSYDTAGVPPGVVSVLARCTDGRGRTQPNQRDPDRRTYLINHLVPTEVTAR